ncbi:branched-chain amino acid ABC transporter permease [Pusillimonas sp.]|uniref:branched-chain amino acid ABC transporter permease n=1 Tax=Pusillimonas sp. TaxID=3040095 RepID=UPI0029B92206|nr:branched-chain amino acid ABC transporter permease [Pusillimonas sp.]MDX3896416.1 branched-chain amino acid ABC transporter permease [Pusillimonas sp.]
MDNSIKSRFGIGGVGIGVLLVLALLPIAANLLGQSFYITLFARIMIYAIAAVGLNLALGYGGMVSLGHALYIGIGAYAAGILSFHGVDNGVLQLLVALVVGALFAVLIGLVCLRTGGMAFIMITLAFSQMLYFVALSLRQYGGDDGLPLAQRSIIPGLDLENGTVFYYTVLVVLAAAVLGVARLVHSHFGWVVQGCKSNERRMAALGFPAIRYKLATYVLSALICVVAGYLLANLVRFASPSYLHWVISGELIVMVVLGGIGTLFGPVIGAVVLLSLEEILTHVSLPLPGMFGGIVKNHPMAFIGLFIVVMALASRTGLQGLLRSRKVKS